VRGTIHWVSAEHALDAELRLYDHLFADSDPDLGDDLGNAINPASVEAVSGCKVEPSLAEVGMDETLQFERTGYFCLDSESAPGKLVFNRTIGLRDSWAKVVAKGG
jgi:glutaminyl-tRNA synthetase